LLAARCCRCRCRLCHSPLRKQTKYRRRHRSSSLSPPSSSPSFRPPWNPYNRKPSVLVCQQTGRLPVPRLCRLRARILSTSRLTTRVPPSTVLPETRQAPGPLHLYLPTKTAATTSSRTLTAVSHPRPPTPRRTRTRSPPSSISGTASSETPPRTYLESCAELPRLAARAFPRRQTRYPRHHPTPTILAGTWLSTLALT
jgi:hypothetical protein